ncbi:MAG: KH domain-containing protein [Candidatus Micrarchaeia archaeon]
MNAPICEIDVATGSLCSSCSAKMQSGELEPIDLKVCEFLYKRNSDLSLGPVDFRKAVESDKAVVVITDSEPGLLIGFGGKIARELSKFLGKHVKVVGSKVDLNTALSELLTPLRVRGVNTVFRSGGKAFKVRLSRFDEKRLPLPRPVIERVMKLIYKEPVIFEFE